jgi:membrane-associated protease RseP (regulator of RpoE activity)
VSLPPVNPPEPSDGFYSQPTTTSYFVVQPVGRKRSWWKLWGRNAVLFLLTAVSIYLTGGWRLMVGTLAILTAHEMGHYLACRHYGIRATLPFFIPAPVINWLTGTAGAVIVIRSPFPNRKALFDVGVAGPLAGFVVTAVVAVLGTFEAVAVPAAKVNELSLSLGEPLLLQWSFRLLQPGFGEDAIVMLGPFGMAAWFGMLVTALNLVPIGQFDGGHLLYALFPRWAHRIARGVWWCCVGLTILSPFWVTWVILLRIMGRPHPPTLDDAKPLDRGRVALALAAVLVLAVSFVANPFVTTWAQFLELFL